MNWLEDCGGWANSWANSIAAYVPWAACGLQTWAAALLPGLMQQIEPIYMGHRKFRVLQQLGEGGYAVVLLVQEVPTPHRTHPDPELRALKKVLVQSGEHLEAVQQEMMVHLAVQHHPNILPLLDYCCSEGGPPAGPFAPPPPPSALLEAHPSGPSPVAAAAGGGGSSPFASDAGAASAARAAVSPAAAAAAPPQPATAAHTHPSLHAAFGDRGGAPPHRQPHYHSHAVLHEPQPLHPQALAAPPPQPGAAAGLPPHGMPSDGALACCRVACFLFPVFREGTLAAELERLGGRGERLATADVLSLFIQMARATRHIHAHGYAHRDLKPLNVLIASNPDHPDHPANRERAQQQQQQQQQPSSGGGGGGGGASSSLTRPLRGGGAPRRRRAGGGGGCGGGGPAAWRRRRRGAVPAGRQVITGGVFVYRCVVMDFGSARPAKVQVPNRAAALALQEDAEAHCSAPYRAPELLDVPSPGDLDYRACDVWALGASLFQLMYGEPPFARAMNAAGGSLALAVLNCAIGWPRPPAAAYAPELHALVAAAMAPEPGERPSADQLVQMAEALAYRSPPLPEPRPQQ
ncbi:hypothetical protein HXX76_013262 [Chlamydomonas incerta]|uniref:non-specific serine/threonine protein kinase n=1 Tax=Chlamydomonas incerta TaxID=51695 RepID=A0A835VUL8_CHLIN|nr:hypothetical protein HXX76_013262 [Chlamydomonas incerta]|eukprot:KAG2426074.1 hypothetical protein HXX76_013262 [Chlamydomonas incerta]